MGARDRFDRESVEMVGMKKENTAASETSMTLLHSTMLLVVVDYSLSDGSSICSLDADAES